MFNEVFPNHVVNTDASMYLLSVAAGRGTAALNYSMYSHVQNSRERKSIFI